MWRKIVSWSVLFFLFVPLIQSGAQLVQARLLGLGGSIWPEYAMIRNVCMAGLGTAGDKRAEVSESDSALLEELDLGSSGQAPVQTGPTETQLELVKLAANLTWTQALYCGVERRLSWITIFATDYIPMTMVVLLLVAGTVSTTRRYHIALRNPENSREEIATEVSQIVANLIVLVSAAFMLPLQKGVEAQIQVLWIVGLAFLSYLNVHNLLHPVFKSGEGRQNSNLTNMLLCIPLYSFVLLDGFCLRFVFLPSGTPSSWSSDLPSKANGSRDSLYPNRLVCLDRNFIKRHLSWPSILRSVKSVASAFRINGGHHRSCCGITDRI